MAGTDTKWGRRDLAGPPTGIQLVNKEILNRPRNSSHAETENAAGSRLTVRRGRREQQAPPATSGPPLESPPSAESGGDQGTAVASELSNLGGVNLGDATALAVSPFLNANGRARVSVKFYSLTRSFLPNNSCFRLTGRALKKISKRFSSMHLRIFIH
jgi:hypothetical protein